MKGDAAAYIRALYNKSGHETLADLRRAVNSALTLDTWCRIVNNGEQPSTKSLLVACYELGAEPDQISKLLVDRGDKGEAKIAKLIAPTPVSSQEMTLLEKIRNIGNGKLRAISNLIDDLRNEPHNGHN